MDALNSILFAYVFNAIWQVPLLVLAAEAITFLLREIPAVVIHRIWVVCLFLAIMLPALSFLPGSTHGFVPDNAATATQPVVQTSSPANHRIDKRASPEAPESQQPIFSRGSLRARLEVEFLQIGVVSRAVCVLYLVSILFPLLKLVRSVTGTRSLLRSAEPVVLSLDLQQAWQACLDAFELTQVEILSSTRLSSPATLTWLKPIIILPKDLRGAEVDELAAAFCHELAHVRRGDFVLNLFYETSATLLFFHPALHWILRRLAEARELACDDIAASAMAGRRTYAKNLLRFAQRLWPANPQLTCTLGVFETQLMEKRVMNLIGDKPKQARLRVIASIALCATLLIATFALTTSFGVNPVLAQAAGQTDHAPSGWFLAGSKPANYRTGVDKQMLRAGLPSAYLLSSVQDADGFGTLMQSIGASQYAGKRVRLRGWIRARDVTNWAGLWMRIDKGQAMVGFDNMRNRAIRGTRQWKIYDVVLNVPTDATGISFGTLLAGPGEVWLNDLKFEVVGQDVPTTAEASDSAPPATPVNLNFQE
jgi:beta-lactamase regulating signal transducer with metallopeptidase domain